MPNPKAVQVVLSDVEREQLEAWARRRKSAQALAQRSRMLLSSSAWVNTGCAAWVSFTPACSVWHAMQSCRASA